MKNRIVVGILTCVMVVTLFVSNAVHAGVVANDSFDVIEIEMSTNEAPPFSQLPYDPGGTPPTEPEPEPIPPIPFPKPEPPTCSPGCMCSWMIPWCPVMGFFFPGMCNCP